ncbi:hypothetical protein ACFC6L_16480 [Kitasatospora phosalacinea]|uniref:hypothetical protein n=1 Tax=Kitasatospora phosalacinea TaxID=2065 RepID=UPI0035E190BC
MPTPPIVISLEPSGAVVAKGTSDDLAAALLKHAGFRETNDWYGRRHRLPTSTPAADRSAVATHAAEMLRAARYDVDLDPQLDAAPLTAAGQQVLQLCDQVRATTEFAELAGVVDQLLDPDDGVLVRLQEALELVSEQITDLDPEQNQLADHFGFASDQLSTIQAELDGVADSLEDLHSDEGRADVVRASASRAAAVSAARAASPAVAARGTAPSAPSPAAPPQPVVPRQTGRTR